MTSAWQKLQRHRLAMLSRWSRACPTWLRGLGLASAGQFADALPHFRHAVQADPLFYAAKGWLGMSLIENGQKREGRAVYGRVITRTASPFYWSSWAMQEISDPEALKHALEMAPPGIAADTTDCLRSLAVVLTENAPRRTLGRRTCAGLSAAN